MIKITDLKKLKKDKYLIQVEENDKTTPHIVTENTIIKYNLLRQKTMTKSDYQKIIKNNEYELLYLKAINYISYQMRTISEVKKHLKKDIKDEKIIMKLVTELKQNNYVNDKMYVEEYVNQKMEFDLVGPKYIKDKLITKGIHFDLITENLRKYNDEVQFDKVFQIIKNETKYKQKKPYQKVYMSLKQKLINKGFSLNVVESSLISCKDDIKAMIDEKSLLQNEIQKLKGKYNLDVYEEKNKLIKKLMTKGYSYELIKNNLK